jgi:hypothetical protein
MLNMAATRWFRGLCIEHHTRRSEIDWSLRPRHYRLVLDELILTRAKSQPSKKVGLTTF